MSDPGADGDVPDAVRRVWHAAAVLGEQVQVPYVAAVAGVSVDDCVKALDEAVGAGLLAPGGVLEGQAAARVLEALSPAELADLRRRAADEALRRRDFTTAGAHYTAALHNPAGVDAAGRARLLLGAARAAFGAGLLEPARESRAAAREIAVRLGAAELLAEVALALEPVGDAGWDAEVDRACADALAAPRLAEDLRVRVLARQTQTAVYAGRYAQAEHASGEALARAESSSDVDLLPEALTARQLARSGPDDVDELLQLAERMRGAGTSARRADVELWGRLWRVDALAYRGDLPGIGRELAGLEDCARRAATPYARWHLALTRATLAVARAEFEDAEALLGEAYGIFSGIGHPAVHGARVASGLLIGHHRGHRPELLTPETWDFGTDLRWDFSSRLARAFVLADVGELDEAMAHYRRCGDLDDWSVPRSGWLVMWAWAARVATALGLEDDVTRLRDRLAPYRGLFVAGGAGASNILGPVELTLGRCSIALGRYDDAVGELAEAGRRSRAVGAVGFAVEADCLRAEALAGAGDPTASQVADSAVPLARALGMVPWLARLEELAAPRRPEPPEPPSPLSPREREVAALVAEGLTNRAIAERLVIAERTAQNHVQHILDKLGFTSRAQIAVWAARRE